MGIKMFLKTAVRLRGQPVMWGKMRKFKVRHQKTKTLDSRDAQSGISIYYGWKRDWAPHPPAYTRIHPFRRLCQSAHPICVAVWGQLRIWSASSALTPGGKAAFDFPGELRRHFRASKSGFFQMRAFVLMSVLETWAERHLERSKRLSLPWFPLGQEIWCALSEVLSYSPPLVSQFLVV